MSVDYTNNVTSIVGTIEMTKKKKKKKKTQKRAVQYCFMTQVIS